MTLISTLSHDYMINLIFDLVKVPLVLKFKSIEETGSVRNVLFFTIINTPSSTLEIFHELRKTFRFTMILHDVGFAIFNVVYLSNFSDLGDLNMHVFVFYIKLRL